MVILIMVRRMILVCFLIQFTSTTQSERDCSAPSFTLNGTSVAVRKSASTKYSALTEIKFIAQLPSSFTERYNRLCKIKCIAGEWMGPLCQGRTNDTGPFHPILRDCKLNLNGTNMLVVLNNLLFRNWNNWLPDRSRIILRCEHSPGVFKFVGQPDLQCIDGDWDHEVPQCILTSFLTNFSENSPPTISVKIPLGYSAIDFRNNEIYVYPGSIVHLECLFPRQYGDTRWTWATTHLHSTGIVGWAIAADEREHVYRMSIYYVKSEDSGNYTCITPKLENNTVSLRIKAVQCENREDKINNLVTRTEGNFIGQRINYFCENGFDLMGANESLCLTNGEWSSPVPHCLPISCPPFSIFNKRLIASKVTMTYKSIINFRCDRGYILKGASEIRCEIDGKWSSLIPTCVIDRPARPPT